MRLVETDQSISLVTSAAGLIDVVAMVTTSSAISGDVTASDGGSEYAEISSAGTTTIVAAPASASLRKQPTDITIRNAHTSVTNTVTILFNDTSASLNLEVAKATLAPGEALTYTQGGGWVKLDANGGRIPVRALPRHRAISRFSTVSEALGLNPLLSPPRWSLSKLSAQAVAAVPGLL